MKPSFALHLSHDGISLLHRGRGGWVTVGDVALDEPDLTERLAWMRKTAAGLATGGVTTKLILPNTEILYDEVPAPGPTDADREAQVRAGLEGRTPYAVQDLAYDYVVRDGLARVAVVARETLAEAEAFAIEHRFNPVSFVAIPPEDAPADWFSGEPLFGTTRAADTLLDPDDPLERDDAPVTIIGKAQVTPPVASDPVIDVPASTPASALIEQEEDAAAKALAEAKADADAMARAIAAAARPAGDEAEESAPPPSLFASRRAPEDKTPEDNAPDKAAIPAAVADRLSKRSGRIGFFAADPEAKDTVSDPAKPAPAEPAPPRPAPAVIDPPKTAAPPRPVMGAPKSDPAAPKTPAPEVAARTEAPTPAPQPALPMIDDLAGTPDALDRAGMAAADTLFADAPRPRSTPSLGLMLTGGLLAVLLLIALLVVLFSGGDEVVESGQVTPVETPAIAPVEEATAPIELPEDAAPVETAEVPQSVGEIDDETVPRLGPIATAPAPVMPLAEAEAFHAETGIWPRAPEAPMEVDLSRDEGIFLAALDPEIGFGDAVALPGYAAMQDLRPTTPLPPIGPGVTFDLDENSLVVLTPDGAVTPEGIEVRPGSPALVPPARPVEAGAAQAAADEAAAVEANDALALLRPRARPENADEVIERNRLGGFTLAELQQRKPRPRPESEQALAAAEALADAGDGAEASPLAVASSRNPAGRPTNIAELVAAARAAQPERPVVATAAVARAAPSIPTSASVARQATLTNAISLRRINLIGVYGSQASRRALVRLPSGRITRVEVGDRLDGGRVAAIGDSAIQYVKNGRNVTLALPSGG